MRKLNPAPRFMVWAVWQAVRHPRRPITYLYCPDCKIAFHPNEKECPKCKAKVGESPEPKQQSPIPWYGSVFIIVAGIICWILGDVIPVQGLDEAGRALVYVPLGSLFGMSLRR